jgi:hypothetical protein
MAGDIVVSQSSIESCVYRTKTFQDLCIGVELRDQVESSYCECANQLISEVLESVQEVTVGRVASVIHTKRL